MTILNGYADGIDPDCCHHVRIANCYVEAWDDAIVPKASFALGYRRSTENVTVTNCVLTTGCNCFKLGTESSGDFKNITVSNCAMFARPDLWKKKPTSGVALEMVDGASVERIAVSNIVMADMESPIFIRLGNRGRAQAVHKPEHLEDISITDIVATGAERASSITGIPGYPRAPHHLAEHPHHGKGRRLRHPGAEGSPGEGERVSRRRAHQLETGADFSVTNS